MKIDRLVGTCSMGELNEINYRSRLMYIHSDFINSLVNNYNTFPDTNKLRVLIVNVNEKNNWLQRIAIRRANGFKRIAVYRGFNNKRVETYIKYL